MYVAIPLFFISTIRGYKITYLLTDTSKTCAAVLVRPLPVWPSHHFCSALEVFLRHGAASARHGLNLRTHTVGVVVQEVFSFGDTILVGTASGPADIGPTVRI